MHHQQRLGSHAAAFLGRRPLLSSTRLSTSKSRQSQQQRSHIVYAAKDYYQVLGVSKDADKKAMKSAYRLKLLLIL